MKAHNCFISNSSSSSFVLALSDEVINDENTLEKLLFPVYETVPCPYSDKSFSSKILAKIVFDDLHKPDSFVGQAYEFNKIIKKLEDLFVEEYNNAVQDVMYGEFGYIDYQAFYASKRLQEAVEKLYQKRIRQKILEFLMRSDVKSKKIYLLEYSDHTELGRTIEQGNIFRNIPHLVISQH